MSSVNKGKECRAGHGREALPRTDSIAPRGQRERSERNVILSVHLRTRQWERGLGILSGLLAGHLGNDPRCADRRTERVGEVIGAQTTVRKDK